MAQLENRLSQSKYSFKVGIHYQHMEMKKFSNGPSHQLLWFTFKSSRQFSNGQEEESWPASCERKLSKQGTKIQVSKMLPGANEDPFQAKFILEHTKSLFAVQVGSNYSNTYERFCHTCLHCAERHCCKWWRKIEMPMLSCTVYPQSHITNNTWTWWL